MAHTVVQSVQTYMNDLLQSSNATSEEGSLEVAQSMVVTIINQLQQYKFAVATILGVILIATLMSGGQKLPPGTKALPQQAGKLNNDCTMS